MTEDIVRTYERALADFSRQREDLAARQEQLTEMRGHGESPDGLVRVEAAVGGRVTKVELEPKVMRKPSMDLAADIQTAIDAATADAATQAADLFEGALNPSDTKSMLAGDIPKSLPGPQELREIQQLLDESLRKVKEVM